MKLHNTLLHYYKYSGMGMKRANCLHGYGQSIINKHCLLWIAVPIKQRMKIILCKYENAHSTDSILLFVLWLFHQSFMKFNTVIQFLKASFVYRLITANSWRAFWLQFFLINTIQYPWQFPGICIGIVWICHILIWMAFLNGVPISNKYVLEYFDGKSCGLDCEF